MCWCRDPLVERTIKKMGIRCALGNIAPEPGVWDFDGESGSGNTTSIAVFRWKRTADGHGMMAGRWVKRLRGKPEQWQELIDRAEAVCQMMDSLNHVSDCPDAGIRARIAGDPISEAETLASLRNDPSPKVRVEVAVHKNTPSWVLEQLAADPDPQVREKVAFNPNTPESIIRVLAVDPIGSVFSAARRSTRSRGVAAAD